jgi:hypothetical protein
MRLNIVEICNDTSGVLDLLLVPLLKSCIRYTEMKGLYLNDLYTSYTYVVYGCTPYVDIVRRMSAESCMISWKGSSEQYTFTNMY